MCYVEDRPWHTVFIDLDHLCAAVDFSSRELCDLICVQISTTTFQRKCLDKLIHMTLSGIATFSSLNISQPDTVLS